MFRTNCSERVSSAAVSFPPVCPGIHLVLRVTQLKGSQDSSSATREDKENKDDDGRRGRDDRGRDRSKDRSRDRARSRDRSREKERRKSR